MSAMSGLPPLKCQLYKYNGHIAHRQKLMKKSEPLFSIIEVVVLTRIGFVGRKKIII